MLGKLKSENSGDASSCLAFAMEFFFSSLLCVGFGTDGNGILASIMSLSFCRSRSSFLCPFLLLGCHNRGGDARRGGTGSWQAICTAA